MSSVEVLIVRREGESLILDVRLPEGVCPTSVEDAFFHGLLANRLVQYTKTMCRMDDDTIRLRCFPCYLAEGAASDLGAKKDQLDRTIAHELGFQLRNYATK
ncbi:hypothetical protein E6P97_02145 [Patescibacteria group bacterium]|nr:MAG: hypothetical protein E6P97_02145 [Patescibacteria group bacterium]